MTVPSLPTMPDGFMSVFDEAEVLRDLFITGLLAVSEEPRVLKITRARALYLQALWMASSELQEFVRRHRVAPELVGLLALIERLDRRGAQRMATVNLRREVTTAGLHEALDVLVERQIGQQGGPK
jgi:hypothetical protein